MSLYDLVVSFENTWFYTALLVYFAWYPIATSAMWIYTAILFYRRREYGDREGRTDFYLLSRYPRVSFVIPAFNEEANIVETLAGVLAVDYPDFEVVVVDDFYSGLATFLRTHSSFLLVVQCWSLAAEPPQVISGTSSFKLHPLAL